jgi:hypothetical protein
VQPFFATIESQEPTITKFLNLPSPIFHQEPLECRNEIVPSQKLTQQCHSIELQPSNTLHLQKNKNTQK